MIYVEEILSKIPIPDEAKSKILKIYSIFSKAEHSYCSASYCLGYIKHYLYSDESLEDIEYEMYGKYDDLQDLDLQRMATNSVLDIIKTSRELFPDSQYRDFYFGLIYKIIAHENIMPVNLTKNWVECSRDDKGILYYNSECSNIYKQVDKDGKIIRLYDVDKFSFKDVNDDVHFTTRQSVLDLNPNTVMYTPSKLYLDVNQVQSFVDVYKKEYRFK